MMSFERENKFYKYAKPRETRCGIKSRTARGHSYGANWWSRRWVQVMEQNIDAGRLARGKSYARKGQVVNITIEPGLVTAFVQGTRKTPYQIRLGFEVLSQEARELILFRFRESASFAAKLLAGEMPEEIETIFIEAGAELFPTRNALRRFKCSCPDDATPCKHIIAVLLILAEEIEDDPFLLLKLRGLDKDSLVNLLTLENTQEEAGECAEEWETGETEEAEEIVGGSEAEPCGAPMREDVPKAGDDWYAAGEFSFERADPEARRRSAALDVMNDFPFWRGDHPFRQTLAPFYEHAAVYAGEVLTGEKKKPVGRPRKLI